MDRKIIPINENWKFHLGDCGEAFYKGWDDSNFKAVTLPHDWSVTLPFERTNSSGTGYLSGGIGWYRLHLALPEAYKGKKISLHFDGIYKNSQVWFNSYNLGKHPNGYTPVVCDISDFARFGKEENVIAVKVVHTDIADSRWFTGSGITRGAAVVIEERVHPKTDGVYLYTTSAQEDAAEFVVHHELVNDTESGKEVCVTHTLFDAAQKPVWVKDTTVLAEPGKTVTLKTEGILEQPMLWDVEAPHLYTLRTTYALGENSYLCDERAVGLRTAVFDADKGFFLNGKSVTLKGVCVHHDAGALGAAATPEVWERRLKKLKECGCNAIRCSHNPHMPALYDLCDSLGFLMMDEGFDEWECPKNKWATGHNVYPPGHQGYAEDFPEWHERDLRAMVRRDRHHPSVILWSIGNEIDYPNDPYCHPSFATMTGNNDANKPQAERMYDADKPNMERMVVLAKELSAIVKKEDGSRPVTMALAFPELSAKLGVFAALDVAGYNYKEKLYDGDHAAYPDMPILGSENSHSYAAWRAVKAKEFMGGQFLWTGIDYLGEAHGWPVHGAAAGLLSLAGFEKQRFWARKSYWCDEPVLVLSARIFGDAEQEWIPCTRNWNYEENERTLIRCFSNLPEVALLLNGRELARQKGYNGDGCYQFEISFAAGELAAVGYDDAGEEVMRDSLKTAGPAAAFKTRVWQGDGEAQNGYLYQIELFLQDENGNPVTWEEREVSVSVCGAGRLKGIENGNLADNTPYTAMSRHTYNGELLIYVQRIRAGKITVHISAEGMEHGETEISMD